MGNAIIINNHMSFAKNNIGKVHISYDNMNYFKITANEDITISFNNDFEYNNGSSFYWTQYKANTQLNINNGEYILLKANLIPTSENGIGTFNVSGDFSISGNVLTLTNDTLKAYAFKNLFKNCTSLTDISELTLTNNIAIGCYECMFYGCSSITETPVLESVSLADDCYKEMFYGCSSLSSINVKSEEPLSEQYSYNWVYGVAEEGSFIQIPGINHPFDDNGCPAGWKQDINYIDMYFTIESLADSNQIKIQRSKNPTNPTLSYSLDDGETWTTTTISGTVTFGTINTGQKIIFKGTNARFAIAYDNYNFFDATKQFKVYGNIMSLFNGDDFKENSEFDSSTTHHCAGLLRSTYLVDASNLILPSLTIYSSSYNGMFRGDTALQYGPQMLATTPISTGTEHCSSMFEGCINLEEAIDINFTTLAKQCCFRMFLMHRTSKITTPKMTKSPILRCATGVSGCYDEMFKGNGNLVEVTCLLANDSAATNNWLVNVSSAGTFYKSSLKTNWPTNASGVPSGWTIVDYTE